MTPSFDSARLAELPADLRKLFEAQRAMLEAERVRAEHERAARLHVESELAASKETVERLQLLVKEYERARFGKRSEKFDPDQLQLVLEDIEIAIAEVKEREDDRARRSGRPLGSKRAGRAARAFPAHLPRVERVIEPPSLVCPCGCGQMIRIGEDRSSRLDVTPAQYRVIETVRPRYACSKGFSGVAQAPAPAHLIENGVPTEALLAQIAVAKFSEHMPLYRQSQVFARHGILLDRAVLADWMGTVAFHLAPLVERMSALMKRSGRLSWTNAAPVLDPGRGRTKTGLSLGVLRDDRGHGGADMARRSGWEVRDNQDGDLRSRRSDDCRGASIMQADFATLDLIVAGRRSGPRFDCRARRRPSCSLGLFDRGLSSVAVDVHLEDRRVVDEPVDGGERHGLDRGKSFPIRRTVDLP